MAAEPQPRPGASIRPQTRARIVEVLSNTANGCLQELGYTPGLIERLKYLEGYAAQLEKAVKSQPRDENAERERTRGDVYKRQVVELMAKCELYQRENVKLYEDNSRLVGDAEKLRAQVAAAQARAGVYEGTRGKEVREILDGYAELQAAYKTLHASYADAVTLLQNKVNVNAGPRVVPQQQQQQWAQVPAVQKAPQIRSTVGPVQPIRRASAPHPQMNSPLVQSTLVQPQQPTPALPPVQNQYLHWQQPSVLPMLHQHSISPSTSLPPTPTSAPPLAPPTTTSPVLTAGLSFRRVSASMTSGRGSGTGWPPGWGTPSVPIVPSMGVPVVPSMGTGVGVGVGTAPVPPPQQPQPQPSTGPPTPPMSALPLALQTFPTAAELAASMRTGSASSSAPPPRTPVAAQSPVASTSAIVPPPDSASVPLPQVQTASSASPELLHSVSPPPPMETHDASPAAQGVSDGSPESQQGVAPPEGQDGGVMQDAGTPPEAHEAITPPDSAVDGGGAVIAPGALKRASPDADGEDPRKRLRLDVDMEETETEPVAKMEAVGEAGGGNPEGDDAAAMDEDEGEDEDEDEDGFIEIGPDGLRTVQDCLGVIFPANNGFVCRFCIAGYEKDQREGVESEEPTGMGGASVAEQEAHCTAEHSMAWKMLRECT
ncbi:hypothetical protein B0H11DRAFT_1018757 [Mycena galericulata]|nr:hypothetical protein B0H11DRAFT_1018757 [Mycena galericulata]